MSNKKSDISIPQFKNKKIKEPVKYTKEQFKKLIDFKDTCSQYSGHHQRHMFYYEMAGAPTIINNGKRPVYLTLMNHQWDDDYLKTLSRKSRNDEFKYYRPVNTKLKNNQSFEIEGFYRYGVKRVSPFEYHKKTNKCVETTHYHNYTNYNQICYNYAAVISSENYNKMKEIFVQANQQKNNYIYPMVSDILVKDCNDPLELVNIVHSFNDCAFVNVSPDDINNRITIPDYGPGNKSNSKLKRMQLLAIQDIFCIDELSTHKGQIK
jgi:hypothetical protein